MIAIGDGIWTWPSNLAKTGHLYSYDTDQNATFPAEITATAFNGEVAANNITGVLPIEKGGTGATTVPNIIKMLCNSTANTAPSYVIGLGSSYQNSGYTSM